MLSEVETSPEYFCYLGGFFTAFSMTAEMKFEQVLKESLKWKSKHQLCYMVCTECRRLVLPRPDEYIGSYILCPWIYVGFLYFCACKYKS